MPTLSVVIPAYNESRHIGVTLSALQAGFSRNLYGIKGMCQVWGIVVVDDGSEDDTALLAEKAGAIVIRLAKNRGKGGALTAAVPFLQGDVILLLDADLAERAPVAFVLVEPVVTGKADLTIAGFLPGRGGGGFGIARKTADWGIKLLTGRRIRSPLSGQRCLKKEALLSLLPLSARFGMEVGMTIDALKKGYRVLEVETRLRHSPPGRDLRGFLHRGRQFYDICVTLGSKAGRL